MNQTTRHIRPIIRFRKWSRKAYAVFASLGKEVVIARVGKSITEVSLSKVSKYTTQTMRHTIEIKDTPDDNSEPPDLNAFHTEVCFFIEPTTPAVPHILYPNRNKQQQIVLPFSLY